MEKYTVISHENEIEYHVIESDTDDGTLYQLFASDNPRSWSEAHQGKLRISALDTGNDLVFTDKISKTFDYMQFEMHMLLSVIRKDDTKKYPYKIVKTQTILTI